MRNEVFHFHEAQCYFKVLYCYIIQPNTLVIHRIVLFSHRYVHTPVTLKQMLVQIDLGCYLCV